jgi:hypothetical protein
MAVAAADLANLQTDLDRTFEADMTTCPAISGAASRANRNVSSPANRPNTLQTGARLGASRPVTPTERSTIAIAPGPRRELRAPWRYSIHEPFAQIRLQVPQQILTLRVLGVRSQGYRMHSITRAAPSCVADSRDGDGVMTHDGTLHAAAFEPPARAMLPTPSHPTVLTAVHTLDADTLRRSRTSARRQRALRAAQGCLHERLGSVHRRQGAEAACRRRASAPCACVVRNPPARSVSDRLFVCASGRPVRETKRTRQLYTAPHVCPQYK